MTSRDEQYRRNAKRLRAQVVALAAEVVARGGALDDYLLSDEERAEAIAKAPQVFRDKFLRLQARLRYGYAGGQDVLREPSGQPETADL
jgi:hypothetical protein